MEQERQGSLLVALILGVGVALFCALAAKATGFALFDYTADVAIPAAAEPLERGCIAQYAATERWTRHRHIYECARATRDVPANVLTYPLAAQ